MLNKAPKNILNFFHIFNIQIEFNICSLKEIIWTFTYLQYYITYLSLKNFNKCCFFFPKKDNVKSFAKCIYLMDVDLFYIWTKKMCTYYIFI